MLDIFLSRQRQKTEYREYAVTENMFLIDCPMIPAFNSRELLFSRLVIFQHVFSSKIPKVVVWKYYMRKGIVVMSSE